MTQRAVVYARVSPRPAHADNAEDSLATQVERCRAWAGDHGQEVIGVFTDDKVSGGTPHRDGMNAAIDSLRPGMVLLAYSRDRIARSLAVDGFLSFKVQSKGATIQTVVDQADDSPEGRLMQGVIASMAQFFREAGNRRTSDAMKKHMADGRMMSSTPPYGMMVDPNNRKLMVWDPDECETIRRIVGWADEGLSVGRIVKRLTAEGIPARGKRWHETSVRRILKANRQAPSEGGTTTSTGSRNPFAP